MNLSGLRAFVAVVDHGGFNAAADALSVAQPSLTRKVQQLEAELGVRLLDRGPWGIRPTSAGRTLVAGAKRILETVAEVEASVSGRWTETVRLGAAATAAGSFLARRLSSWLRAHPTARLAMIEAGASQMRFVLEKGECDLGIVAGPVPPHFDHRYVTTVTVQALLPLGHRLADSEPGAPLDVTELHREVVVTNSDDFLSNQLLRSACQLARVEPDVVYQCSVGQTLAALAESGLGIAIMGDSVDLRGYDLPRRPLRGHDGNLLSFTLHVAWPRRAALSPVAMSLVETLCG
ncbi:MAG TPA: LysR family transcriptional regulator [Trueperaceae bacterium]|jgi:DNA-binding transcriptional LysR family regulator